MCGIVNQSLAHHYFQTVKHSMETFDCDLISRRLDRHGPMIFEEPSSPASSFFALERERNRRFQNLKRLRKWSGTDSARGFERKGYAAACVPDAYGMGVEFSCRYFRDHNPSSYRCIGTITVIPHRHLGCLSLP